MAKIIAVNAGSSSLKFSLFAMKDEEVIVSGVIERIGFQDSVFNMSTGKEKIKNIVSIPTHKEAVDYLLNALVEEKIVDSLEDIKGVGHRVVQGGSKYKESAVFDEEVASDIDQFKKLAPLHNPANLTGYYAFKEAIPNAGAVAVFDTAFHQTIEPRCFIYPIPYHFYENHGIRKYGAHGSSHYFVSQRVIEFLGKPAKSKIIVAHLGAGASMCAVKDGKSHNTSMGFTPLSGVMMGTRSGDCDPSVIDYLTSNLDMDIQDVIQMLNKESGLLGISGVSSDFRDVEKAALEGNERAKLALDIFYRRIIAYLGRYYVALGGADAIAFTAGIGENSFRARKEIIDLIAEAFGIVLDEEANEFGKGERLISKPESKVKIYVIPTNEELVIARDTKRLLGI
ncbi:MAG: acetate kinase [Eubacteriales bacterium]